LHQKKIPSSVCGIDYSQDAKDWSSKLHLESILLHCPTQFLAPPPVVNPSQVTVSLSSIAEDIHLLQDATECQHLNEITNDEDKKNSSSGWDKSYQKRYKP
jgi:hypothetical protein